MDLPDGELRGKVGPWAHLMTLHNAWLRLPFRGLCCADIHTGGGGAWGLSETALTGRMRAEGLHLSCLLRSWLTDGCTYQLCAILLIKSQRRAWLNMEELACLRSSPHQQTANRIVHGFVRC